MNRHTLILSICGIIAPALYTIVVIVLSFLWSDYNPVAQAISELGGPDAPNAIIMNTVGFALTGILITAFAYGLHRGINEGRGSKIGPALVAVYGLGMVGVGLFPWDKANLASSATMMHSVFGWIHWIAITLAPLVIARRFKNDHKWKSYRLYGWATGLVTAVLIVIYLLTAAGAYGGVIQRMVVGAQLLWIEIMAIRLLRLSTQSST